MDRADAVTTPTYPAGAVPPERTPEIPLERAVVDSQAFSGAKAQSARSALDATMTEAQFAVMVERMLRQGKWNYFHPNEARRSHTILDYVCWKDHLFWAELKTMGGRLSKDRWVKGRYGREYFVKGQESVIAELRAAGQTVYVWRPSHLSEIARILLGEDATIL